ncbi:efflux RND transporter periplasmic adaptor subunit [Neptunicella sp. SCSIO 80796]|uniref:efflux RND transporter periplasmic adaptor subunit n=1 Tax=Neptunicella plasticusilytica TaxID=3117012 RepID=UPI003A4E0351
MKLNRRIGILIVTSAIVLSLTGCDSAQSEGPQQQPPQQVDVVKMTTQDVIFKRTLPARSVASREAEVRPQVSGIIVKRHFEEGALVEEGQPLYQIDDAIYQANYHSAQAELSRTESNLKKAAAELKRYKSLIKGNAVSQQDLDQAEADYQSYEAELGMRKAELHKAKVDIQYTKVLAPISGRISKSNVTEGALVTAQQANALATIIQLDPIYFDLPMAHSELRKLQQRLANGELTRIDATAELIFSDGETYPHKGELKFNEVQTNPSTDAVALRVQFNNPEYALLPGMYAKVKLNQAKRADSILVPQKAVQFDHSGSAYVFVLGAEQKVEQRNIKIDRAFDKSWLVTDGLDEGDQVIVTGLQKIAPGMKVQPAQSDKAA